MQEYAVFWLAITSMMNNMIHMSLKKLLAPANTYNFQTMGLEEAKTH
jgi:hypothetical protein